MSKKGGKSGNKKDLFGAENLEEEANSIIKHAKETDYLVTGIPNVDGTFEELKEGEKQKEVPREVFETIANKVAAACPNTFFMLIGVGPSHEPAEGESPKRCSIYVHSANPLQMDPLAWLEATGAIVASFPSSSSASSAFGYFNCEFPLKGKDQVSSMAFVYLRKQQFLKDDDSEDERPSFDINED